MSLFKLEKKWQFVALATDQAFVSAAIADFGYLGYGFAYVYDRASGRCLQATTYAPLALGVQVAPQPDLGGSHLSFLGKHMSYEVQGPSAQLRMTFPSFQADLRIEIGQPFDSAWKIPSAGDHRTRKRMGDLGAGTLTLEGRTMEVQGHALFDWSRGLLARETSWRWAAGVGMSNGRRIGWNLRTGFDDPSQAENAVWIDGAPTALGPATIEPGSPWTIQTGPLVLRFDADGAHKEDLNLGLIASRYQQPWGRFVGTWEGVPLKGYGVVEDHWARW